MSHCLSCPPPEHTSGSKHGTDSHPENSEVENMNSTEKLQLENTLFQGWLKARIGITVTSQ